MKKTIMTMLLLAGMLLPAGAQKFALVDMEYILKNIPAYERANEQLSQTSKKWQAEVEALNQQAQTLYKNYQNELVFLSAEQKKQREEAILAKEKEASDLKKKYFSPEGELYTAVKGVAEQRGYALILDRASDNGIVFASPTADISNEVLAKLGYSN